MIRLKSIKSKFIFFVTSLILAIMVSFILVVINVHKDTIVEVHSTATGIISESLRNSWEEKIQGLANVVANQLIQDVYTFNISDVSAVVKSIQQQQIVKYIYVLDPDGIVISDGNPVPNRLGAKFKENPFGIKALASDKPLILREPDTVHVSSIVKLGNQKLATLLIGFSTSELTVTRSEVNQSVNTIFKTSLNISLKNILILGGIIILIGLVAAYIAAQKFTRPIKNLSDIAGRVGKGQYDVQLSYKTNDELGDLIRAFDHMQADLKKSTISVDMLEKEVARRSHEIILANEKLQQENTERKKAEDRLKQHQEELERRVDERAHDIIKMNKRLKQQIEERHKAEFQRRKAEAALQRAKNMEAIGTLAAGVAHDLNNVLSGVVGYPELILLDLPDGSPLKPSLEEIQVSAKKATDIVQDLLTLARRGIPISEVVNLKQIVTDYIKSPECKKLLEYHPGVRIETNFEKNLANMRGSPIHLSKTLMNLVSNASEAMYNGGTIAISLQNTYMDLPTTGYEYLAEGEYVILSVEDEGIGIPDKDIEHIFEPFYSKKKMGRSGTGLGMAVVWGTVKDHKGYIDIHSVEGKGTTFTLYFPASREILAEGAPEFSVDAIKGNGESILVVDDVKTQREIACKMLKTIGYAGKAVSSGEEAVTYLEKNFADLILLDMIMDPGMDGLDTYRKILDLNPDQKVIIASGYSESDRIREVQRLGVKIYLKKPYSLEQIGKAIKSELGRPMENLDSTLAPDTIIG